MKKNSALLLLCITLHVTSAVPMSYISSTKSCITQQAKKMTHCILTHAKKAPNIIHTTGKIVTSYLPQTSSHLNIKKPWWKRVCTRISHWFKSVFNKCKKNNTPTIRNHALNSTDHAVTESTNTSEIQISRPTNLPDFQTTMELKGDSRRTLRPSFSTNGNRIAFASGEHNIHIYNTKTGEKIRDIEDPHSATHIALSHDGTKIAVTFQDGKALKTFDVTTGLCIQEYTCPRPFTSLAFSPDDKKITATSVANYAKTLKLSTGLAIDLYFNTASSACTYNQAGDKIVVGLAIGRIVICDVAGNQLQTLVGHTEKVNSVAYNRDETKIISASKDGTIKIWDPETGTCIKSFTKATSVLSASFNFDETKIFMLTADNSIKVLHAETGSVIHNLWNQSWHTPQSITLNPQKTMLAIGSSDGNVYLVQDNEAVKAKLAFISALYRSGAASPAHNLPQHLMREIYSYLE